jgi:hypothetical protein
MTSIALTPPRGELSPRVKARIAGFIYLIIIVGGAFAQLAVRDGLVVNGNPTATAHNILAHELRYRLGFAIEVFYLLCGVPLKLFLYDIFKVVDRKLAIAMVLFAAIGAAIQAVVLLAHYAPLILLGNSADLSAFTTAQLQGAAYLSLRMFDYGYMIALAFFGCFCLVIGYLILRSTFFPRLVGPLLITEGLCYLTNSFAHFIAPAVGDRVFPFLLVSGLAEVSFCLTLLIAGVNVQRWKEQRARHMACSAA